jgi:16S rRNA (guanine966-N2)-methyltransferase
MTKRKQSANSQAGRLRIVAGNWRSRLLEIAHVEGTLFNWLAPQIHGARCLDLYAGTGALGLEALSRGAASAVFVEVSRVAAQQLRRNVGLLKAEKATVLQQDALEYLYSKPGEKFDIVFLDPPFAADLLDETCRLLAQQQLLSEEALVYLEQDRSKAEPELPEGCQMLKNKTAGNVRYMLVQFGGSDGR